MRNKYCERICFTCLIILLWKCKSISVCGISLKKFFERHVQYHLNLRLLAKYNCACFPNEKFTVWYYHKLAKWPFCANNSSHPPSATNLQLHYPSLASQCKWSLIFLQKNLYRHRGKILSRKKEYVSH